MINALVIAELLRTWEAVSLETQFLIMTKMASLQRAAA